EAVFSTLRSFGSSTEWEIAEHEGVETVS
ncbi:hypothetical protein L195_g013775, partial [Trifolium pratense]